MITCLKTKINNCSGVYSIINKVNNKFYIGSSIQISTRFRTHKYLLRNNKHYNPHLQAAWLKYGEDCFLFVAIEECEQHIIRDREQWWIDLLQACNPEIGYNIAKIIQRPSLGTHMSEENKAKLRALYLGKKRSPEVIEKMRLAMTPEIRKKIGDKHRGKKISQKQIEIMRQNKLGKKATEETKQKQSESLKAFYAVNPARTPDAKESKRISDTVKQRWKDGVYANRDETNNILAIKARAAVPGFNICYSKGQNKYILSVSGTRQYLGSFNLKEDAIAHANYCLAEKQMIKVKKQRRK